MSGKMQLKTNYKEMTNQQLADELTVRCNTIGDSHPTYVDSTLEVKYGENVYFFQWIEDDKIIVCVGEDATNYKDVPVDCIEGRSMLLSFLQAPIKIFSYTKFDREVSQEEFLKDLEPYQE